MLETPRKSEGGIRRNEAGKENTADKGRARNSRKKEESGRKKYREDKVV